MNRHIRILLMVVGILLAHAPRIDAEDVAGVITAMPDAAAERRYLGLLCDRLGEATTVYLGVVDGVTTCTQDPACAEGDLLVKRDGMPAAERAIHARNADLGTASDIFRAKRAEAPPVCSHREQPGADRIKLHTDTLIAATKARYKPDDEKEAACRAWCAESKAVPACDRSCDRYRLPK